MNLPIIFKLFLLNLFLTNIVICNNTDDETQNLTPKEQEILDKFIEEVGVSNLPHEYMKEPLYLLRFLKSADWKIDAGKKIVDAMIKWRTENNIDNIINESFDDVAQDFPSNISGIDKHGRPFLEAHNQGKWPIVKYIGMGNIDRLKRYTIQQIELATVKVRERKEKVGATGPNKANILTSLAGLNTVDTVCSKCMVVYVNFAETLAKYYPYAFKNIVIINAPRAYDYMKIVFESAFGKDMEDFVKVFDNDQKKWVPYVKEHFNDDQIHEVFKERKTASDDKDIQAQNLTPEQLELLDKFMEEVDMSRLFWAHMKEPLFLMRFLKSAEWKIDAGKKMIDAMLEWRKENKIDGIINEKFEDIERDFPTNTNGVDKKGRPILEAKSVGKWPIANYIAAGQLDRLKRYTIQQLEIITMKVRLRKERDGEEGPTQAVALSNLAGLNTFESACPKCVVVYANIAESIEKFYPYAFEKYVLVNAPRAYDYVEAAMNPVLSKDTIKIIRVFDANEKKWLPFIQEHFSDDQIDEVFRGKMKSNPTVKPFKPPKKHPKHPKKKIPPPPPPPSRGVIGDLFDRLTGGSMKG